MRLALIALLSAAALAACGKAPEEAVNAAAPPAPAPAAVAHSAMDANAALDAAAITQPPAEVVDMVDCAGAFAAVGKIDPAARDQNLKAPWFQEFASVQMSIMTAPNSPGAAAMSDSMMARRAYWNAQAPAAQLARAEACKTQY